MLKTEINGVVFENPVITASGTFGFGHEYAQLIDVAKIGGICSKGLTLNPKYGNEGQRLCETPAGLINSIGLQNPGIEAFIKTELPKMQQLGPVPIANLGGGCEEDYLTGAAMLDKTDVPIIELNISCPNVKAGGMAFGIKAESARDIVSKVRKMTTKPLWVKLSPNCENIVEMALACQQAGADALSLVNTFQAMAIDIKSGKPVFNNIFAGLSGPAIMPIALRMVYQVCAAVQIPVIGIGGIATWQDALQFIMAGAHAVQVGAATFANPNAAVQIVDGLRQYCEQQNIENIQQIRSIAQNNR